MQNYFRSVFSRTSASPDHSIESLSFESNIDNDFFPQKSVRVVTPEYSQDDSKSFHKTQNRKSISSFSFLFSSEKSNNLFCSRKNSLLELASLWEDEIGLTELPQIITVKINQPNNLGNTKTQAELDSNDSVESEPQVKHARIPRNMISHSFVEEKQAESFSEIAFKNSEPGEKNENSSGRIETDFALKPKKTRKNKKTKIERETMNLRKKRLRKLGSCNSKSKKPRVQNFNS